MLPKFKFDLQLGNNNAIPEVQPQNKSVLNNSTKLKISYLDSLKEEPLLA